MQYPDQDPSRFRQPSMLSFSVNWRCYPRNLGLKFLQPRGAVTLSGGAKQKRKCQTRGLSARPKKSRSLSTWEREGS